MKSELLSQEKNVVRLKVTVPVEDVTKAYDKTVRKVASQVNIPGFRKGKAPRNILEARFGVAALRAEAMEELLPGLMEQLIEEYELEPIQEPKVDFDRFEADSDVEMTVTFVNQPEVTLPDFASITVEKPVMSVTDQMVEDSFGALRTRLCTWSTVDREAKEGDRVKATYCTTIKNEKDKALSSHEPREQMFMLDKSALREEVLAALVGAKAGETKNVEVKIDESYQNETLAGNRACYEFGVLEVQESIPAELNEELFKKIDGKATTEEEAKVALRAQIEANLARDLRNATETDCVNKVVAASDVELPESMIERQEAHLMARAEENVKNRTQLSLQDYYAASGQDFEAFKEELKKQAREDVKRFLVMDAVAKELGVTVTEQDLNAEVEEMAGRYGVDPASVKKMLVRTPDELRNYASSARTRKVIAELLNRCVVREEQKGNDK